MLTPDPKPIITYVAVDVHFTPSGMMIPLTIRWESGKKYKIDEVSDVRRAAGVRSDGVGIRYTVHINGRQSFLFFEQGLDRQGKTVGRWFVERR